VNISVRWARYWFEKAAAQGHRQAKVQLRRLADTSV